MTFWPPPSRAARADRCWLFPMEPSHALSLAWYCWAVSGAFNWPLYDWYGLLLTSFVCWKNYWYAFCKNGGSSVFVVVVVFLGALLPPIQLYLVR